MAIVPNWVLTTRSDASLALLALKTLGKNPTGSSILASPENLCTLLDLAISYSGNDEAASSEALRCIANALLLIESARGVFVETEVNGGEVCVEMLKVSLLFPFIDHLLIPALEIDISRRDIYSLPYPLPLYRLQLSIYNIHRRGPVAVRNRHHRCQDRSSYCSSGKWRTDDQRSHDRLIKVYF